MAIVSAENNFRKGLEALIDENFVEAAMHFRRAMDIEIQRRVARTDMRYLSYYGLCRAKAHGRIEEGVHACRRAVRGRPRDPEMYLNLGRALLAGRRRRQALDAFRDGLRVCPGHVGLRRETLELERRIPSLTRPAGLLSRFRHAFSRSAATL